MKQSRRKKTEAREETIPWCFLCLE